MYRGYKIVICIAAGRREHLEILKKIIQPYREVVDKVHLWMNTLDFLDRNFIKRMSWDDPWFEVIKLNDDNQIIDTSILWHSVCKFYKFAMDFETIYIKADDDIVVVDDLVHFKQFLDFRIDNPQCFLVSANVLNNAILTREHQLNDHFSQSSGLVGRDSHDKLGMYNGPFAEDLHRQIIEHVQDQGLRYFDLKEKCIELTDYARLCINWISWFGADFNDFQGEVPQEDEEWLTTVKTKELQRSIRVCPTFQVVHFAFSSQRKHLSATDLLVRYKQLAGLSIRP